MSLKIDFLKTLDVLLDSYKNIDFRCALYNKGGEHYPILTIFRFSNEEKIQLEKKYNELNLSRYKTENFEIIYEALDIKDWKQKFEDIYKNIVLYSEECPFEKLDARFNTSRSRLWLTENEVKNYNIINFYCTLSHPQEHHSSFSFLNKEIVKTGEKNIYSILKRALQLDLYDINVGLYFSFILPLYMKFSNLKSIDDVLSGEIEYHEIFNGSTVFLRIFSRPMLRDEFFVNSVEFQLNFNDDNTKKLSENYFKTTFNFDFSKYDCDPNFNIRVLSEKIITGEYIIDLEKSFDTTRWSKSLDDIYLEVDNDKVDDQKFLIPQTQRSEKEYIESDFLQYQLPDYTELKNLINSCAYHSEFYRLLPALIRNLLENLLGDIFSTCLAGEYTYLYYNTTRGRVRDFSRLIELLRILRIEIDKSYVMTIHDSIFENLEKFRKDGNFNIHQVQKVIGPSYVEKNRETFNITLKSIMQLYRKIINSQKKITEIDFELIKKYKEKNKELPIEIVKKELSKTEIPKYSLDPKEEIGFFIEKTSKGNYQPIMDRLHDERFRIIFDRLFTKIEIGTGRLTLWSNSFLLAIGVNGIVALQPIKKEKYGDTWHSFSQEEKIKIFLDDFKERVNLIYGFKL